MDSSGLSNTITLPKPKAHLRESPLRRETAYLMCGNKCSRPLSQVVDSPNGHAMPPAGEWCTPPLAWAHTRQLLVVLMAQDRGCTQRGVLRNPPIHNLLTSIKGVRSSHGVSNDIHWTVRTGNIVGLDYNETALQAFRCDNLNTTLVRVVVCLSKKVVHYVHAWSRRTYVSCLNGPHTGHTPTLTWEKENLILFISWQ